MKRRFPPIPKWDGPPPGVLANVPLAPVQTPAGLDETLRIAGGAAPEAVFYGPCGRKWTMAQIGYQN